MLTPYPQIVEYNEAVQNARTAFRDAELRQGRVKLNALGLPVALSGGFALTYMMTAPRRRIAVRCFHREIPAAQQKYAALATAMKALNSPYFVGFDYLPDGIRIRGGWYPVVRMEWAEGDPLGIWLDRNSANRPALEKLRDQFAALAVFLEQHQIAHGDIQNGNVIVSPSGLKLVDYDGVYVPGMPAGFGSETGHKHFQHPGRVVGHFGPTLDRFSFIAVDLSLAALIEDPGLYRRFRQGGETILFRANDFADPDHSEVLGILRSRLALAPAAQNFAAVCRADIQAVPSLSDFRAGRNIPRAAAASAGSSSTRNPAPQIPAAAAGARRAPYIAAYPVLHAEDFAAVRQQVGHRVELVGRVQGVTNGLGERGRRRGKSCVALNFAAGRGDGVKVMIWTADPAPSSDAPDERWVGRCISVVGLVEPPYTERRFWSQHTHIGISTENVHEIEVISEAEMHFRRHRGASVAQPAASSEIAGQQSLGERLREFAARLLGPETSTGPVAAAAPAPTPQLSAPKALSPASKPPSSAPKVLRSAPPPRPSAAPPAASQWRAARGNQDIVRALRSSTSPPVIRPAATPAAVRPTASGILHPRVPVRPPARPARPSARTPSATPKSGSIVIHPRSPASEATPRTASAPQAPSLLRRALRFIAPEA